jgi:hypothetical protein
MSPVPTRRPWLPGAAFLAAAVTVAVLSGLALGVRSYTWYAGFAAASLLLAGWLERLRTRKAAPPAPSKIRSRLKVIEGGKARGTYDLSKDRTTDSQRYLM